MFYEVCTGVGLWLVVVVVLLLEVPCCFGGVAMLCSKGGEDGRSFLLASLLCHFRRRPFRLKSLSQRTSSYDSARVQDDTYPYLFKTR